MQNYPSAWGPGTRTYGAVAPDTLGRVLGLLGMASIFTAVGALIGPALGVAGFWIGLIGALVCLFALYFAKEKAPLNLILLFAFATFEGIVLGQVLEVYIAGGLGIIVLDAAATTAVITLGAGAYGYTTKRDLSGLGGILFMGLLILIVGSFIGIFLHVPLLYLGISLLAAVLFTGFLIYDLNRVANAGEVSQGDAILLAVSVYLDIFNLFLALLRIFGWLSGRD
jgi:modulator of FtsH protease